jgi:hypothetical protein
MAQDWYTPATAFQTVPGASELPGPLPPQPAFFHLRPLSLGEILDRTFSVYRSHFTLFAGMTAVYAVVALVLQLANLYVKHLVIARFGVPAGSPSEIIGASVIALLLLMPASVMQAGTVYAVSEVYLGKPTTAVQALRTTVGKWYRYIGVALWASWSMAWLSLLLWIPAVVVLIAFRSSGLSWLAGLLFFLGLCALPYGIWAGLRNGMGVQVTVIEGQTVRLSMRRSKVLTVGAKWRMIVIGLIYLVLISVISMLQMPMLFLVAKAPLEEHTVAQAISLVINALGQTVVTPVGLIALSLLYFDQRVRQEALDLLMMLGPEPVIIPQAAPEAALAVAADAPLIGEVQPAVAGLPALDSTGDDVRIQ